MAIDPTRVAILCDQGTAPQTLALFDRTRGTWSSAVVTATDGTPLPYMTDVGLLPDGQVALMAPTATPGNPLDCAVVTPNPPQNVTLAPYPLPNAEPVRPALCRDPGARRAVFQRDRTSPAAAVAVPGLFDDRRARRLRPDRQ